MLEIVERVAGALKAKGFTVITAEKLLDTDHPTFAAVLLASNPRHY